MPASLPGPLNPSGDRTADEFAVAIDNIPKTVFSHTLKNVEWESATLAKRDIQEEALAPRQQPGKDILVGSRSLIVTFIKFTFNR